MEDVFMWIGVWTVYKGIRHKIAPKFGMWLYRNIIGYEYDWAISSKRETKIRHYIGSILNFLF